MTTVYLYDSEYYCDDCHSWHDVGCWLEVDKNNTSPFYVTDSDGDVVQEFDTYEEMFIAFPEGRENIE